MSSRTFFVTLFVSFQQYFTEESIEKFGASRPSPHLWVAEGVSVRIGCTDHYDLHIDAKSVLGKILTKFVVEEKRLDDDAGKAEGLRLLIAERDSGNNVS